MSEYDHHLSPSTLDLAQIDKQIARAHASYTSWRTKLSIDPESVSNLDPIEPFRSFAGQRASEAIKARIVIADQEPHRDALSRWVVELTQWRIGLEGEIEWEKAAHEKAVPCAFAQAGKGGKVSWNESWNGLIRAMGTGAHREVLAWYDAITKRASALGSIARENEARRFEVSRKLGLESPWSHALFVPREQIASSASLLLERTHDLALSLLRESRRGISTESPYGSQSQSQSPLEAIHLSLGTDSPEGWPARLTPRWLDERFGAFSRGLRINLPKLPTAIAASSFARALEIFGHSFRIAAVSRSLPFALACDPVFVDAHRFGFVFGSLASSSEFQRKALGNGARVSLAQSRSLTRTALFQARACCAHVLLTLPDRRIDSGTFEEITSSTFGAPFPIQLFYAWPGARPLASARLVALMTTLPIVRELVDRFDVDWFNNPRSVQHLRAISSAPANDPLNQLDADRATASLARAFEEALA